MGFQIYKTSVAAEEFGYFLVALLKADPQIQQARSNYVFFMDNFRTHKAKAVQDILSEITVCYSAPYSPFLNPIEEMFSTWKHSYRKIIHAGDDHVVTCITRSVLDITSSKLEKYWRNSLKYVLASLKQEEIG